MSAVAELAAKQNGTLDAATAIAGLEAMWTLAEVHVSIEGARITGRGRDASCEIRLSNGETLVFERQADIASGGALAAELASCAGVAVKLTNEQRLRSIVLIRALAERQEAETADSIARWWGSEFLSACQQVEADMADQAERWAMFERLQQTEPWNKAREEGCSPARLMLVPVDLAGVRYVRVSWYTAAVRQLDATVGPGQIVGRMLRVGWQRRGSEGRIGARRPNFPEQTNLKFLLVPAGWEMLPWDGEADQSVTAGNRSIARAYGRARDRGSTNGYHPNEPSPEGS